MIDSTYTYLFYESTQPYVWQRELGWNIPVSELENFFKRNMEEYGFKGKEIDDFIEYWIPKLKTYMFYSIFPQSKNKINEVIKLNLSKQPDNLLRLFYIIKGSNKPNNKLIALIVKKTEREGYYITEWGVILY